MGNPSLRQQKLEPRLIELLASDDCPASISVIVQTVDGPNRDDEELVRTLQGKFVEQFHIIPALIAELSPNAVEALILCDRIKAVSINSKLSGE